MDHFIEQSFKAIRYYLLNQPISESQLTILKETDFTWGNFKVDAKILGESHMVTISDGNDFLQEICACTILNTPSEGLVMEDELLAIKPVSFQTKNLSYSFSYQHIPFVSNDDCQKYLEGTNGLNDNTLITSLIHKFPPHPENIAHEPVTLLRVETNDEDLTIKSIHTYPNEHVFVYTESKVVKIKNQ